MTEMKCDICGKTFLGHDDNNKITACDGCRKELNANAQAEAELEHRAEDEGNE